MKKFSFFVGECGSARAQRSGGNSLVGKKHRETRKGKIEKQAETQAPVGHHSHREDAN